MSAFIRLLLWLGVVKRVEPAEFKCYGFGCTCENANDGKTCWTYDSSIYPTNKELDSYGGKDEKGRVPK